MTQDKHFDIIVIGTGIAENALLRAPALNGKKILIIGLEDSPPLSSALLRLKKEDFGLLRYQEGVSPAWPIAYEDLEPFYAQAERLYGITKESSRPVSEPLLSKFNAHYLNPFRIQTGRFNGTVSDPRVVLLKGAGIEKIETDDAGRKIREVKVKYAGESLSFSADIFICSAGAVSSAALLLKSRDAKNPKGLANSSGLVGKNYMRHNRSVLIAIDPFHKVPAFFQKPVAIHDYYLGSRNGPIGHSRIPVPIGHIELTDIRSGWTGEHSFYWRLASEDLPKPENSVQVADGKIYVSYTANNLAPHKELIYAFRSVLQKIGFRLVFAKNAETVPDISIGTTVFGKNPKQSVLNIWCRAHDHDNLYVIDGGFFPSAGAVSPALTIAAQALRVADHIKFSL